MSLPKYVINFDELESELRKNLLQMIDDAMRNKYPQLNTEEIEALLAAIEDLLPDEKYKGLKNRIEQFLLYKYDGTQQVQGGMIDIPAIINDYKKDFIFDKDVYLTGLHLNQTGWKKEDRYSLLINKNKIIDSATTKEIGEHKYFNTYCKVNANTPVSFILHNKSGNSRQALVDLEYIQGQGKTINPPVPDNPDIDDIPNAWDIAVRMQWEENSSCDMDLHGIIGNKHVCFWHKDEYNFHLNWDYRNHISNDNPEILSVKGYNNKILYVYISNYNGAVLNKPVNVKIYQKKIYGSVLLKEYNIRVSAEVSATYGVCKIDLKTKDITDMLTKVDIRYLGNS